MNNNPYQVRGPGIRKMLGRERLFKKLCHRLTKHNICVVGPPSFGKSVLLHHLASHFKDTSNHYIISLYWDLHRRDTPRTDNEFRQHFVERIKDALQPVLPDLAKDLAEYLELEDESFPYLLHLVFDGMEGNEMEGKKICFLAILDGFDDVLAESNITGNLWEEMCGLGHMDSLRLVTGSRNRLPEPYFSELFHNSPLSVGCFEDHDWSGFLDPLKSRRRITFDDSVKQEIAKWTGGVPVLAVALAEQIFDKFSDVTISESDVQRIVEELDDELWELSKKLWKDCPIDLQSDLVVLSSRQEVQLPKERHADLKRRGFAKKSRKNRLRSSCLLMKRYAQEQEGEVETLQWLFGDEEHFKSNIQSVLNHRLDQIRAIPGADQDLIDHVKFVIELLPQHGPIRSLASVRDIEDRALKLIWDAELGPNNRSLPKNWQSDLPKNWGVVSKVPNDRGMQCTILRRKTRENVPEVITNPTQLLVDHLHSIGNFRHHMDEMDKNIVSEPIAASFCLSAISLCESLTEDLARAEDRKRIA